jgi:hypothetical protein
MFPANPRPAGADMFDAFDNIEGNRMQQQIQAQQAAALPALPAAVPAAVPAAMLPANPRQAGVDVFDEIKQREARSAAHLQTLYNSMLQENSMFRKREDQTGRPDAQVALLADQAYDPFDDLLPDPAIARAAETYDRLGLANITAEAPAAAAPIVTSKPAVVSGKPISARVGPNQDIKRRYQAAESERLAAEAAMLAPKAPKPETRTLSRDLTGTPGLELSSTFSAVEAARPVVETARPVDPNAPRRETPTLPRDLTGTPGQDLSSTFADAADITPEEAGLEPGMDFELPNELPRQDADQVNKAIAAAQRRVAGYEKDKRGAEKSLTNAQNATQPSNTRITAAQGNITQLEQRIAKNITDIITAPRIKDELLRSSKNKLTRLGYGGMAEDDMDKAEGSGYKEDMMRKMTSVKTYTPKPRPVAGKPPAPLPIASGSGGTMVGVEQADVLRQTGLAGYGFSTTRGKRVLNDGVVYGEEAGQESAKRARVMADLASSTTPAERQAAGEVPPQGATSADRVYLATTTTTPGTALRVPATPNDIRPRPRGRPRKAAYAPAVHALPPPLQRDPKTALEMMLQ